MAVFQGPHAYLSPSWYQSPLAVPTWNYVAVHAFGLPRVIEDRARIRELLERMVAVYEGGFDRPWRFDLPGDFTDKLIEAIVGFEIPIMRLEAKFKLSQNRPDADRVKAIEALRSTGDPMAIATAELMAGESPRRG